MCTVIGVPFTPLVKPLIVFVALFTLEYPINSSPINIVPLIGKPNALSTANSLVFKAT